MAHHSPQDDAYMRDVQRRLVDQLKTRTAGMEQALDASEETIRRLGAFGATGEYTHGQVHPTDEGAIRLGVVAHEGKVFVDFGTPVVWFGMTPEQADELAASLMEQARQARRQQE